MSTYLVAFVVGEYDYVEKSDPDGVRVRVYTAVGKKEQGRFALDVREITLINYFVFSSFHDSLNPSGTLYSSKFSISISVCLTNTNILFTFRSILQLEIARR